MSPAIGERKSRGHRPKNRKDQIATVSAEAFSELGYHGVSMETIAGRVGVTAASLYRHYAGKYELFRAAVLGLGQQLVEATQFVDDEHERPAEREWDLLVEALVDTALKNRSSGGLYRWEGRYLDLDDQLQLNKQIKRVNRRLQGPLTELRPELGSLERLLLSSAVLSIVGSITDHRVQAPAPTIHTTLARIARDLRSVDLPALHRKPTPKEPVTDALSAAGEYEAILHHAMLLFNERGYRDTGMDDIAAAAHISTAGIYRFFPGKAAILAAVYRRAADRVSSDVSDVLANCDGPRDAVTKLADSYVRRSFANPEIAYVYYAERANVPPDDQVVLHNIQRATVEAWAHQVSAAVTGTPPDEARLAVHAAFALVVDVGRLAHYTALEAPQHIVNRLIITALLGAEQRVG